MDEIRKGPWKPEEDEVLINHVKKHGPREWSSIRSKGLLKRTGKSCRLRWVNKLRPNLKNGCKFTAEEERIVIELQSQFGNKWAKIATFLPGRTDNDAKNFWSSRQKRLARILHASGSSSNPNPKPRKAKKTPLIPSCSMEEQPLSMVQLPLTTNLMKQEMPPAFDTNLVQIEPLEQLSFHQILQPDLELGFSPESQEVLARLDDPYPFSVLEPPGTEQLDDPYPFSVLEPPGTEQLPLVPPFFYPNSTEFQNPEPPDNFVDDFPTDMFNSIEQLPSP